MVLQRDIAAPIWGCAKPGDKISVQIDGQPPGRMTVAGNDGRWTTKIGPFAAGGPHEIVVEGGGRSATLTGFVIVGTDKNSVVADAVIEGDTIVVSSPEVPLPKHVRYGWAWNPLVNLYNKEGLPAITFRTDE